VPRRVRRPLLPRSSSPSSSSLQPSSSSMQKVAHRFSEMTCSPRGTSPSSTQSSPALYSRAAAWSQVAWLAQVLRAKASSPRQVVSVLMLRVQQLYSYAAGMDVEVCLLASKTLRRLLRFLSEVPCVVTLDQLSVESCIAFWDASWLPENQQEFKEWCATELPKAFHRHDNHSEEASDGGCNSGFHCDSSLMVAGRKLDAMVQAETGRAPKVTLHGAQHYSRWRVELELPASERSLLVLDGRVLCIDKSQDDRADNLYMPLSRALLWLNYRVSAPLPPQLVDSRPLKTALITPSVSPNATPPAANKLTEGCVLDPSKWGIEPASPPPSVTANASPLRRVSVRGLREYKLCRPDPLTRSRKRVSNAMSTAGSVSSTPLQHEACNSGSDQAIGSASASASDGSTSTADLDVARGDVL